MKKIISITLLVLSVFVFNSCEDDVTEFDYVGFEAKEFVFGVDLESENTREIDVYTSKTSSSDRTFNLSVVDEGTTADPGTYTIPATVTVPANTNKGTITMTAKDLNIGSDGKYLILQLSSDSEVFTGEDIEIFLKQVCPFNEVFLDITFDDYPDEIYWSLVDDATGDKFAESATPAAFGAYTGLTGGISQSFCLPDGSYTFTIYDGWGDGAGPVSLSFNGTKLFDSDGSYGSGVAVSFSFP